MLNCPITRFLNLSLSSPIPWLSSPPMGAQTLRLALALAARAELVRRTKRIGSFHGFQNPNRKMSCILLCGTSQDLIFGRWSWLGFVV